MSSSAYRFASITVAAVAILSGFDTPPIPQYNIFEIGPVAIS